MRHRADRLETHVIDRRGRDRDSGTRRNRCIPGDLPGGAGRCRLCPALLSREDAADQRAGHQAGPETIQGLDEGAIVRTARHDQLPASTSARERTRLKYSTRRKIMRTRGSTGLIRMAGALPGAFPDADRRLRMNSPVHRASSCSDEMLVLPA